MREKKDKDAAASIKPKRLTSAEREAMDLTNRENVLSALRRALKLCKPDEYKSIHDFGQVSCSTFWARAHKVLELMLTNQKKFDTSVLQFLPNGSMQQALGVKNMSQFLVTPLSKMVAVIADAGMELPMYIRYLHPDFLPPVEKELKQDETSN